MILTHLFLHLTILYLHRLVSNGTAVRNAHRHTGWQFDETHTIENKLHQIGNYVKYQHLYRGADKSLAWPGKKQATATEDFDFHISYL
jgi:hypothetical protein